MKIMAAIATCAWVAVFGICYWNGVSPLYSITLGNLSVALVFLIGSAVNLAQATRAINAMLKEER